MSKHKKHHQHASPGPGKREQFEAQPRGIRISATVLVTAMCVVFAGVLGFLVLRGSKVSAQPVTDIAGAGTDVSLPLSDFPDDTARFYRYTTAAGQQLRFFVMRGVDGVVRAAFDACDTCWAQHKGYHQEGDDMVCTNCGRHFPSTSVNIVTGGCNPAPIDRTVSGDRVVLSAAALASGTGYF